MSSSNLARSRDFTTSTEYKDYGYRDARPSHVARLLLPPLLSLCGEVGPGIRVLDVGCGNGFIAGGFASRGATVVGIDLSEQGIAIARAAHPAARFEVMAAEEDILERLQEEPFDLVISTEVIEHLYAPRRFAQGCFAALRPGGRLVLSTPYHGYWKNLAIALLGGFDRHVKPLRDGGHIKFWSYRTLSSLLDEAGFSRMQFRGAGRIPYLWMSMVVAADKPCG